MSSSRHPYRGFRFPAEIIAHAVWLYHCFSLSLRDMELILAARGMTVSYESIRDWAIRFGRQFAATLKRRGPDRRSQSDRDGQTEELCGGQARDPAKDRT
jgi:putative transposase